MSKAFSPPSTSAVPLGRLILDLGDRLSDNHPFQGCGEHSSLFLSFSGHFGRVGRAATRLQSRCQFSVPHMLFNLLYPNRTSRHRNKNRSYGINNEKAEKLKCLLMNEWINQTDNVLGWPKSNSGFALLNSAIWCWNMFLNKCVIHHFNVRFSLHVFLLMTY